MAKPPSPGDKGSGTKQAASRDYRFDTCTFDRLFPFHLVIERDLQLTRSGPVVRRLLPDLVLPTPFFGHFSIRRPLVMRLDFDSLLAEPERIYLISARPPSELALKGQMVPLEGSDALAFLASPWITDLDQLGRLGLTASDFAAQDSITDLLVLIQAQNTALDDASKLARQLGEARDAALRASRVKSEFLAHMSHELRTPLNAILGFSEALHGAIFGPIADHYRAYAQDIHKSGQLLLDLINDLLDVSRIEIGQYEINESPLALRDLFEDCLHLVAAEARHKGLALTLEPGAENLMLLADARAMRQTMLNLLTNAVKFTHEGSVRVAVAREPDWLVISVSDTGIGIAPSVIDTLFEPFRQASRDISRTYGGSGLGLSICRRLIELHGGTIGLESMLGAGTTVRVRLPAARLLAAGQ
jgi:signal transduction histidine kinase